MFYEKFQEDYRLSNYEKIFTSISTACERNNALACIEIAQMYFFGNSKEFVEKDIQKGISFFNQSCALGYNMACNHLTDIHISGSNGVPVNHEKVLTAMIGACNANAWLSCIADVYLKGQHVATDTIMKGEKIKKIKTRQKSTTPKRVHSKNIFVLKSKTNPIR